MRFETRQLLENLVELFFHVVKVVINNQSVDTILFGVPSDVVSSGLNNSISVTLEAWAPMPSTLLRDPMACTPAMTSTVTARHIRLQIGYLCFATFF